MVVINTVEHEWCWEDEASHLHLGTTQGWRFIMTDRKQSHEYDKMPSDSLFSSLSLQTEGMKREERRRYRHD